MMNLEGEKIGCEWVEYKAQTAACETLMKKIRELKSIRCFDNKKVST